MEMLTRHLMKEVLLTGRGWQDLDGGLSRLDL